MGQSCRIAVLSQQLRNVLSPHHGAARLHDRGRHKISHCRCQSTWGMPDPEVEPVPNLAHFVVRSMRHTN